MSEEQHDILDAIKVRDLQDDIEKFLVPLRKRHLSTFRGSAALIVIGLVLSAAVTIAGILDEGLLAAILGVTIGFVIGVQNAFPIGDKAEFYRLLIVEGENLIGDLKYEVKTEKEFLSVNNRFQKLRKHSAEDLPRGQGMQAVKNLYQDLSATDKKA